MTFKKVDTVKEQEEMCTKDKEIAKYTEEFNEAYEDMKIPKMVEERDKTDSGIRYTTEDVIAMRNAKKLLEGETYE